MILVTGATGFVGSSLVRLLLARGEEVRVLARAGSDRQNLSGLDVSIVEGDLLEPASLPNAVKGCSGLYHAAADYRLWTREPEKMFAANVNGSVAIIRAAMDTGIQRIVYTSSVATLGIVKYGIADEETAVSYSDMIGVYKQSKYKAEQAVQDLVAKEAAPVVIVNPSTPIGPRDIKPTPTGRMIVEAAAGRMPAFVDTGLNIAHVDDVAAGHLLAFDKGEIGQRYILGGTDMTLSEILAHIALYVGRKPPRVKIPHNAILPIAHLAEAWTRLTGGETPFVVVDGVKMAKKKMYFSSQKAIKKLGYNPRPAADALDDAIDWFKAKGYF